MYKVLIVEDDPMVCRINEEYVRRDGRFSVAAKCANGMDALTYLKEQPVDLVVLDVYMPQMDGLEVLRRLREQKCPVDVVMVTAANDRAALEEALHLGVVDYLVKPFARDRFQLALEKFLLQKNALDAQEHFSQQRIDALLDADVKGAGTALPKGIQAETLARIQQQLQTGNGHWQTGDEIAAALGLSAVTVRRYLSFLTEQGKAESRMNYETGGRPCMQYRS